MNLTMPTATKAEEVLLARMLKSVNAVNLAINSLNENDFFDSRNKAIFSCMFIAYQNNQKIEPLSIVASLEQKFPKLSDPQYVIGLPLMHGWGDEDEVKEFIDQIKKASQYRQMMQIATLTLKKAAEGDDNPEDVQAFAMQEMERVFSESASATTRTLEAEADFMDSGLGYLDFIKKQQINSAKGMHTYQGMPTGFTQLDDALSGICRGHFIIIGARPGVGKTTFALNLIHQMALMGIKIGFFSFEMTADEAMHKLICLQGRVDQQKAMRGMINSMEYNEVMNSYHECKRLPIYIEDQSPLKISQVVARTKRMIATFGIQVLFVDYLGEIKGDGKFTNKQEEIQMVSRGLRQLAKAMRIPIVCICQLNREAEKEQRAPRKSDLRESGQIEADAHSILMLHQEAKQQVGHVTIPKQNKISEDDYAMEGKQLDIDNTVSSKMILYIVKNRFGAQRKIEYQFDGSKGRFTEMSSMKENINELRNRFSE